MTPTLLLSIGIALFAAILFFVLRSGSRDAGRTFELGAVSTRWLSELRRDEPWTRS
jgi:hypothetical protein